MRDVFPYAPSGRPLMTGQRVFAWLWRRVERWRLSGTRWLPAILNLRNLFQVLVSADHRYGPLYSFGIARVAADRLRAAGCVPGDGVPVVLLGSSGGGQISLGAATYLADELGGPLAIVTFGGVMASDRGIDEADRAGLALRRRRPGLCARPRRLRRALAGGGRLDLERRQARRAAQRARHRPDGPRRPRRLPRPGTRARTAARRSSR